jgi:hypothetical protein
VEGDRVAELCCAFCEDFRCTDEEPGMALVTISAPVGAIEDRGLTKGNLTEDVKKVQTLLNKVSAADGGALAGGSLLNVDGICGPKTRAAIRAFQKKQFPEHQPDVIVDPMQRTIYRLNELTDPGLGPALVAKATAGLATVRSYVANALTRVTAVLTTWGVPDPLFPLAKDEGQLNENFHLDRSTARVRDLMYVRSTLQSILTVCGHIPRGPNQKTAFGFLAASPAPSRGTVPYAFAYAGGWQFRQGESGNDHDFTSPMRLDFVYLTQKLLTSPDAIFLYVMVHELAHFVGGRRGDIDAILDRAYFHKELEKYKRLDAFEATNNADSYAQYVWLVNRGEHFRP